MAPGNRILVTGWDMTAALALAEALGINRLVAGECLPALEGVMVRKRNDRIARAEQDGR